MNYTVKINFTPHSPDQLLSVICQLIFIQCFHITNIFNRVATKNSLNILLYFLLYIMHIRSNHFSSRGKAGGQLRSPSLPLLTSCFLVPGCLRSSPTITHRGGVEPPAPSSGVPRHLLRYPWPPSPETASPPMGPPALWLIDCKWLIPTKQSPINSL